MSQLNDFVLDTFLQTLKTEHTFILDQIKQNNTSLDFEKQLASINALMCSLIKFKKSRKPSSKK